VLSLRAPVQVLSSTHSVYFCDLYAPQTKNRAFPCTTLIG